MIVIVTGPMRSGTSAVARICHQMGISMGHSFIAPPAGTDMDLEYEDATLAEYMMSTTQCEDKWFQEYAVARISQGHKRWGFKSPLVLPILEPLVAMYKEIDQVVTICCQRPKDDAMRSLESAMFKARIQKSETLNIINAQHEIYKQLKEQKFKFDLIINHEDVHRSPLLSVAEPIAQLVGLKGYDRNIALHGIEDRRQTNIVIDIPK